MFYLLPLTILLTLLTSLYNTQSVYQTSTNCFGKLNTIQTGTIHNQFNSNNINNINR
jgi:hypothetical protein